MTVENHFTNEEAAHLTAQAVSFSFGENWRKFTRSLNPERIHSAQESLKDSFGFSVLKSQRFIDLGSGSGLFSLCAKQLGASPVISVDIDPSSVACALHLKKALGDPPDWEVLRGSVLDSDFLKKVGPANRVYSWGVLHHTGAMWDAIANATQLVAPGGLLCLALYNWPNRVAVHLALKRTYNRLPSIGKVVLRSAYGLGVLGVVLIVRKRSPLAYVTEYDRKARGMSFWRDVEDWLGGLPCEFAGPEEVTAFVERRGFKTRRVLIRPPGANNEYLFERLG